MDEGSKKKLDVGASEVETGRKLGCSQRDVCNGGNECTAPSCNNVSCYGNNCVSQNCDTKACARPATCNSDNGPDPCWFVQKCKSDAGPHASRPGKQDSAVEEHLASQLASLEQLEAEIRLVDEMSRGK